MLREAVLYWVLLLNNRVFVGSSEPRAWSVVGNKVRLAIGWTNNLHANQNDIHQL